MRYGGWLKDNGDNYLERVECFPRLGRHAEPFVLQALSRGHALTLRGLQEATDEVLGLAGDAAKLGRVEVVLAGQDSRNRPESVAPVERALAARHQHVGDNADAPRVRGCGGVRALNHLGREELDEGTCQ